MKRRLLATITVTVAGSLATAPAVHADASSLDQDCQSLWAPLADESGMWPSSYLVVGADIDVDQAGAFASDATEFRQTEWQTRAGRRVGRQLARYFQVLARADRYTKGMRNMEQRLIDSREFQRVANACGVG
ncbi:MAG: hypothetical protein ACK5OX_18425 [Desertimonas sp.]